jgi:hypothetical protein
MTLPLGKPACLILRGKKIEYAAIRGKEIGHRRILPGIAGYCRVVGPGEKVNSRELMVDGRNDARPHPSLLPQEKEAPAVAR